MKTVKETLWTRSFIMIIIGNLFMFISFQMLIPTLPPYIKSLGASSLEIGLVTTLFSVGAVLSRPFIGYMLEYKKRKPLVLIGVIALLMITLIYPLTSIVILLLLLRFIHGLAWGWSTTVISTAAVDVVPKSRLGEGMGYAGLSTVIALIIAPSLGIYLFQETSFSNLIITSSVFGVIAIILLVFLQDQTPSRVRRANRNGITFSYLGSLVEKSSWFPAFILLLVTFGYGSIITFLVIFGEERGIAHIFLFYLFNALFATLSRPIIGKWFDERGPKGLVLFCIGVTFMGMWVLSFTHSDLLISIAGILFGVGYGSLISTLQSWILLMAPDHRRGVASGMFFSSIDLGTGLSGLAFGLLAQFVELGILFQISSFFFILAAAVTLMEPRIQRNYVQVLK
ncbi:MFS transporter [Bacillus carboniphilus]|uniref:MFS transporter n=1 Tax=Bacillus carboniphilus TaxID=86663 RepID=A0ABY9JY46_9BACI|nr:MFS transporter [Bacillus carboniphilus]WLR43263.1 MFS transporter [Bacillus carboniphilus]